MIVGGKYLKSRLVNLIKLCFFLKSVVLFRHLRQGCLLIGIVCFKIKVKFDWMSTCIALQHFINSLMNKRMLLVSDQKAFNKSPISDTRREKSIKNSYCITGNFFGHLNFTYFTLNSVIWLFPNWFTKSQERVRINIHQIWRNEWIMHCD